jgi:glycosyltransferase involved in cell wall biosynthesis
MNTSKIVRRVLFIIPSLKHGGAEIFLRRLITALVGDIEIVVVVIGMREGLAKDFEKYGINVVYLELPSRNQFIRASLKLRQIIRDFQPDVIQSLLYYADFIATLSAFPFNTKNLFWSFRGSSIPSEHSILKRSALTFNILASWLLPIRIIACSEQALDFHKRIGFHPKKITVIPNFLADWVFCDFFSSSSFLTQEQPSFLKLGLAARFDSGKGHIELVKACVEVLRTQSWLQGINLSFAGKGCEQGGRLSSEIEHLPLTFDQVKFSYLGIVGHDDMLAWYQEIDLYVMPSDGEGFPNSLSEAVALGVPAIATNCGSAVDFVGVQRLIHAPDANSIHDALIRLTKEPLPIRISHCKKGMEHMRDTYSAAAVLPLFLKAWSTNP